MSLKIVVFADLLHSHSRSDIPGNYIRLHHHAHCCHLTVADCSTSMTLYANGTGFLTECFVTGGMAVDGDIARKFKDELIES